ncbi:MAG: matrixin family metalloprotease [Myxococcales bacterium]|nr:matrixin family metalloprotease [Myxococcales bacterium]
MTTLSRRRFLSASAFAGASLLAPPLWAAGDPRVLYVQALGKALPDADLGLVVRALGAFYSVEVKTLGRVDLPKSAFYPKRARYRAEKLLDFLGPRLPKGGSRILGLTSVDISTTKGKIDDWGILGLATLDGAACVLSSFRCKRLAKNAEHARVRFAKVAVHEIGHTFGLDHCPNRGCLMEDGGGSVLTTDREYDLCADSRRALTERGIELASGEIPWPKPKLK